MKRDVRRWSIFAVAGCATVLAVVGLIAFHHGSGAASTPPRVRSQTPPGIDWAASLDDALARAQLEDKPIFVAMHVKENGDPAGDV
jgi:hypothetical protein